MSPLEATGLTIFILILFSGVYVIIYGFPGTIIILADAAAYALITGFSVIELKHIAVIAVIALAVEIADLCIELSNVKRPRYSIAGIALSVIGSITGAIVLTPWLFGLGTLIGFFLGGYAGLLLMQQIEQRKIKPAFRETTGGTLLRSATVCCKGSVAIGMVAFLLSHIHS